MCNMQCVKCNMQDATCKMQCVNWSASQTSWTSWTDQMDEPAGQKSWTYQLDRPAGRTSWMDQFFLFEALASSHIQRFFFQFVHCRSFRVRRRPCFVWCPPPLPHLDLSWILSKLENVASSSLQDETKLNFYPQVWHS